MPSSFVIVMCTERGILEKYSMLLAWSIRTFGGSFSNVEMISIAPRRRKDISKKTYSSFDKLNVKHFFLDLNKEYYSYPFANKVYACKFVAEKFPEKQIVFLDSDQIILAEPDFLFGQKKGTIMASPVEQPGIAYQLLNQNFSSYWRGLYNAFDLDWNKLPVISSINGEKIGGYWNAGFIVGDETFYSRWHKVFRQILEKRMLPNEDITFVDQIAMAVVIHRHYNLFKELPRSYNFPINELSNLNRGIVSLHYHKAFLNMPSENPFQDVLLEGSKKDQLYKKLQEIKLFPVSNRAKLVSLFYDLKRSVMK